MTRFTVMPDAASVCRTTADRFVNIAIPPFQNIHPAIEGKQGAIARQASRQHAIEHVDA